MRWLLVCLFLLLPAAHARAQGITVFAAASLTDALRDANVAWRKLGHPGVTLSFASSSTLARQIAAGAPADLFASADEKWMTYVAQRGAIATATRVDLLTNELVLVVPAAHPVHVAIGKRTDLMALLGPGGRLAIGDPSGVPAGIYARQALMRLGLWDSVKNRLAPAEDVRAALLLVQRGEAPAGIVYATDAEAAPGVAVAGTFPAASHDPVVYPFALTKTGDTPAARAFLQWLEGPQAARIFEKRGFTVLAAPRPG